MKRGTIVLFIISFCLFNYSCKSKNARLKIDVSGMDVNIKIKRYEKDLFLVNPNAFNQGIKALESKYPFFLEGISKDTMAMQGLKKFVSDPLSIQLYNDCQKQYPDLKDIELNLTEAFKHYKYYFPEISIPTVYSYVSGIEFQYPIKIGDDALSISLDMYLGSKYKLYKDIGIPAFKTYKFRKESIVPDCMKEIARNYLPKKTDNTLLSNMVEAGKIIYFTEAMMPEMEDSLKIDYTTKQIKWCENNEARVWAYFIENKLLYNTDLIVINKFIGEGPFTTVFSNQSPSRIAVWVGWQIIRKYMDNFPKVTLKEMMSDTDAQKILMKSKYKPKK